MSHAVLVESARGRAVFSPTGVVVFLCGSAPFPFVCFLPFLCVLPAAGPYPLCLRPVPAARMCVIEIYANPPPFFMASSHLCVGGHESGAGGPKIQTTREGMRSQSIFESAGVVPAPCQCELSSQLAGGSFVFFPSWFSPPVHSLRRSPPLLSLACACVWRWCAGFLEFIFPPSRFASLRPPVAGRFSRPLASLCFFAGRPLSLSCVSSPFCVSFPRRGRIPFAFAPSPPRECV